MLTTPLMAVDTSATTAQQKDSVTNSRQHQQVKRVHAYLDKVFAGFLIAKFIFIQKFIIIFN
jgi:hypothetical protein